MVSIRMAYRMLQNILALALNLLGQGLLVFVKLPYSTCHSAVVWLVLLFMLWSLIVIEYKAGRIMDSVMCGYCSLPAQLS